MARTRQALARAHGAPGGVILGGEVGYDLHIHRAAEDWMDAADNPITLDEWSDFVARAPDFRMDNFAEAETEDGEVLRLEEGGIAVWTGHPASDTAWFSYSDGMIVVKNPDEPLRRRMFEVAVALGARVQGDDGEFYGPDGEPTPEDQPEKPQRRGLRRLFGRRD
jgi:hypothetical protein